MNRDTSYITTLKGIAFLSNSILYYHSYFENYFRLLTEF